MLKLFVIDDGERHWIASVSEAAARKRAIEYYELEEEFIESVDEVSLDTRLTIHFEDEPSRSEVPAKPYQDEYKRWYCTATAAEWLKKCNDGDIVCSTVY